MELDKAVKQLIDATIQAEGGDKFTNDPTDKGGATKFGITQFTYSAYGYPGSVENATYEQAVEIYARRYWLAPKFDQVAETARELGVLLFDWGVTSGQATSAKALQRALNSLNQQGADFPDMTVDGQIGKMTLFALTKFKMKRGEEGVKYLTELVRSLRRVFLLEISERNQSQEKYQNGWQRRV